MARKKISDIDTKKVNKKEDNINIDLLKEELSKYINETIKKEFTAELERSNRRLIREKNIKIITKNMVITVLLLIIVYLIYVLNDNNYFDKFFIESNNNISNRKDNNTIVKEKTIEELKEEYGYLLDNYYINESSSYIEDYYNGNMTSELKNYLTLNTINDLDISKEDGYSIIDEKTFKNQYKKLFDSNYENKSFDYNDNYVRYINKLDSYISDNEIKKIDTNIKREIIDIKVDNDNIIITTVEGLVKDNTLYNIISNEEIGEYNNLLDNIDDLNKVIYTFDNREYLIKIS